MCMKYIIIISEGLDAKRKAHTCVNGYHVRGSEVASPLLDEQSAATIFCPLKRFAWCLERGYDDIFNVVRSLPDHTPDQTPTP